MIRERERLATTPARDTALACLEAGIEAARPATIVPASVHLTGDRLVVDGTAYDLSAYDRVVVAGGGNAAGRVAAELEAVLGDRLDGGVIVTDDPAPTERVEVVEAAHPVPDDRGLAGAEQVRETVAAADRETLVLAVVTGGGSALLPAPAGDVSLADLRTVTEALLASGAAIDEVNAVRKHLSALKGGRLAATADPATVVGLVVSDVVGDDLAVVASGPLSPDPTTFADALDVLDRYDIDAPDSVVERLEQGVAGAVPETPGPGASAFDGVTCHVLANAHTALDAARETARERGYEPLVLSARVRGSARAAATTHVAVAEEIGATGQPVEPPAVVLSGGETTVTVTGDGTGGPNQEFALSAALELTESAAVASVDTDGLDGATDAAGALVDEGTCEGRDREGRAALADNDAYPFLDGVDALIQTGPTGTNVNDLRVLVVEDGN